MVVPPDPAAQAARLATRRLGLLIGASALLHLTVLAGLDRVVSGAASAPVLRLTTMLRPAPSEPAPAPSRQDAPDTATETSASPAPPPVSPVSPASEVQVKTPPSDLARDAVVDLLPGPRYYTPGELDQRPVAITPIIPEYPGSAGPDGGYLVVRILIDDHGRTEKVLVLVADPEGQFEQAVEEAFSKGRFRPGMKGGIAVRSQIVAEIRFLPEDRPGARSLSPPTVLAPD